MQDLDLQNSEILNEDRAREGAAVDEQQPIIDALTSGDRPSAARDCARLYATLVGRYCWVVLGDRHSVETAVPSVIAQACERWSAVESTGGTFRAHLLQVAKKHCAHLQAQRRPPRGMSVVPENTEIGISETLDELRPSEREILVLRYVCGLSYRELASVFSLTETEVVQRLSRAIADAVGVSNKETLARVVFAQRQDILEHLAYLVDGTASESLRTQVAEEDGLRDALHVATQIVTRVARAADGYSTGTESIDGALGSPAMTAMDGKRSSDVEARKVDERAGAEPAAEPQKVAAENVTSPVVSTSASDTVVDSVVDDSGKTSRTDAERVDSTKGPGAKTLEVAPLPKKLAWMTAVAVFSAAALLVLWLAKSEEKGSSRTVDTLGVVSILEIKSEGHAGHVEVCASSEKSCQEARKGSVLAAGAHLRTNSWALVRLELSGKGEVQLGRNSEIYLSDEQPTTLVLEYGNLAVDANPTKGSKLRIETHVGSVETDQARFEMRAESKRAVVQVIRGNVTLLSPRREQAILHVGEQGVLDESSAISVGAGGDTKELPFDDEAGGEFAESDQLLKGLGELLAKKPGETKERSDAVHLARHQVRARIVGAMARTEIEEVFTNDTREVLEGIFRFRLPADAHIERLALEVDGKLVEGAFVDRDRAAAIWRGSIVNAAPQLRQTIHDDIVWVPGPWRDPALLEWQRGNRFELRIYPIPKQGQRRIILAYTQVLPEYLGRRRYSYPLPIQSERLVAVADFSFDLEIRGHDQKSSPHVIGYEIVPSRDGDEVARLRLEQRSFVPRGDIGVEFSLPNRDKSILAWAYQPAVGAERPYAAMLIRPKLPASKASEVRDFCFVVDVSRSMKGESLRRATQVIKKMIRELVAGDRVSILACHSDCEAWGNGLVPIEQKAAVLAEQWLKQLTAEGASDPGFSVESAAETIGAGSGRALEIVYVGDGTPTVGAVRPAAIEAYVRRVTARHRARVTAIAVGTESDILTLRAMARGGSGTTLPYVPGTTASRVSSAALSSILGTRLTDVSFEVPTGMTLSRRPTESIVSGEELLLTARLDSPSAQGDLVLRGRIEGAPFEQRYPLGLQALSGDRNAFVPRLYAAERISELDQASDAVARNEAVELSRQFSVASRHTSLLVLESPAMFKAFGLDNRRQAERWSGELESEEMSVEAPSDSSAMSIADDSQGMSKDDAEDQPSEMKKAPLGGGVGGPARSRSGIRSNSGSVAPMSPAAKAEASPAAKVDERDARMPSPRQWEPEPAPPPRMVPMRRIWERKGSILLGTSLPARATPQKVAAAEAELALNPDRRSVTKQLFDLYAASGDFTRADQLANRWNERDPFDIEAIVARADMAARRGQRGLAVRILGSVVDVRPNDIGAQQRLYRLQRWQGNAKTACRFASALAAYRTKDAKATAEALRCTTELAAREPQFADLHEELLRGIDASIRSAAERLATMSVQPDTLSGDLRLTARWNGHSSVDLDLALIDPDGYRISWLGAPSRSVISALNVTSVVEESLSLRGGKPGEYVIEIALADERGGEPIDVSGSLEISVAGTQRTIPFRLSAVSARIGTIKIMTVPKLVPLLPNMAWQTR